MHIYSKFSKEVIAKACKAVRHPQGLEAAVVFISDRKMRELNRKYRGKDKTANVLAFETGDIFISLAQARREAKKYGWSMRYEIARLALHGFLHVLGFNHKRDKEAMKMEKIEKKILRNWTSTKITHK